MICWPKLTRAPSRGSKTSKNGENTPITNVDKAKFGKVHGPMNAMWSDIEHSSVFPKTTEPKNARVIVDAGQYYRSFQLEAQKQAKREKTHPITSADHMKLGRVRVPRSICALGSTAVSHRLVKKARQESKADFSEFHNGELDSRLCKSLFTFLF